MSGSARPKKASGSVLAVGLMWCGSDRSYPGMMGLSRSCPAELPSERLWSEWTDPAVVVVDCALRHTIAVTGRHHGANEIAIMLEILGDDPVITNVSEVVK